MTKEMALSIDPNFKKKKKKKNLMSSFHRGERRHRDVWIWISVSLLLDSKKVFI